MKILPVGAKFHADGQTEMTANILFPQFCKCA